MNSISTNRLCYKLDSLIIPVIVVLLTLPIYGSAGRQLLATPRDATVNVGSTTNLTCIVGESYGAEEVKDLNWIITWDTTASVQRINADQSQKITGYHYGQEAERGEYYVAYDRKKLNTTDGNCTHVIHISTLQIKNATIRDAGTYACGDEWQKARLVVVDSSSSLDACNLVIIIIGLVCVVGWCLAVVEFGVLICMCLQKPKHAERRRRIVRRVSVLLPQSRRAAYNVRMNKRRENRETSNEMVQNFTRSTEKEQEERVVSPTMPTEDPKLYVNLTQNKTDMNNQPFLQEKPRVQLVTFQGQYKKKATKSYQKGDGGNPRKKKPDSLAIVKPFGLEHSETTNPIFDGGTVDDMYMNYTPVKEKKRRNSEDYAKHMDSDDMVSTPL